MEIPVQAHQWRHTAAFQEDTSHKVSKSTGSFLVQNPVSCNSVFGTASFVLGKLQVQDNLILSMKQASNGAPINVN
jgi:hypothetical protein